jgi:hypothetical protein
MSSYPVTVPPAQSYHSVAVPPAQSYHSVAVPPAQSYKVFVPLMGASVTVDQIRTEIAIQEYGVVIDVQFLPLYKTPKFCANHVKTSDIKAAALTIRKPTGSEGRANFIYRRIHSGKSCIVKPVVIKDPIFEFWNLKKYEETTSEIRESVDELTSRLEELRRIVDTILIEKQLTAHYNKMRHVYEELVQKLVVDALLMEKQLEAHRNKMRDVYEELMENTTFEYRGYTENGCNENTGLDTVTTLSKCITFNYCVKCGEHLDENQHGSNFKICMKCYTGFARNQSYKMDYDDEDYDYELEEECAERLREDLLDSYLESHDDWY